MVLTKETSLFQQDAIQNGVTDAGSKATGYIGDVSGSSGTGMDLHPVSNGANNYIRLDTDGMKVYKGGILIASYGDSIILSRLVSNNSVKALEISSNGVYLYGSSASTADVELTSTGLKLIKGGIQAGTPNASGFVYLSSDSYGNYTINGSTGISDWKAIIGTKFGVTADGTLYANGANITGNLTITGHTNTVASELSDAATKATNFLTNLDNVDGLVIRKDATSNNDYVNIQSNAIRMVTGGNETFKAWVNNNAASVKVGASNSWNLTLENSKIGFTKPDGYSAGFVGFNNSYRRMFVGNSGNASIGDGSVHMGGLLTDTGQGDIIYEHRGSDNSILSQSQVATSKGHITLQMTSEDTPWTYPQQTSMDPSAYIVLDALANSPDYYTISMSACREITIRSPHIRFACLNQTSASQYGDRNYIYMQFIPHSSTGYYMMQNEAGYLTIGGASSSKRYKHDILPITSQELDPHQLYNIEVIQFIYNDDRLEQKDQRFRKKIPGFIAEDVYKYYPIAVDLKDGRPEDWNHRFILPPMLKLIQEQHQEIEELKTKISILEEKIL